MVFANSAVLTQFNRFEHSEFEQLPTPVWVFDVNTQQILWANHTALELGNIDCWETVMVSEWQAFWGLDALGFWQDLKQLGRDDSRIVAWRIETKEQSAAALCLCSRVQMEDGQLALLMQVPTTSDARRLTEKSISDLYCGTKKIGEWQLEGITEAITHILGSQHVSQTLNQALAILGNAMNVDRVCLWQRSVGSVGDRDRVDLRHEWTHPGIVPQQETPKDHSWFSQTNILPSHGVFSGLLCHGALSDSQSPLPTPLAFVVLPITVSGECWGFLSVEDRRGLAEAVTVSIDGLWSKFETSMLQVIASSIGSAITCQQAEAERVLIQEQLERRVEERTFELTSTLKQLSYNVYHDSLTGLPNRVFLMEELDRLLDRVQENPGKSFAILFLDLERFKVINDSLGHSSGDRLLVEVSHRLLNCVFPGNLVVRLGGDEFAIVLKDIQSLLDVTQVAERITTQLANPFYINHQEVFTNASIGIALSSPEYQYPEEILRDADIAIDRAKLRGQSCFAIFDTAMQDGMAEKLRLENELRRAVTDLDREISHCQFKVVYQPIVSLATDQIVGFEALIRWHHPELGLISPMQFIPIAEETGLIIPLGEWILFQSCRQLQLWEEQKHPRVPLKMSVNISGRQFSQTDLISQIDRILELTGVRGSNLKLELTESAIMDNADLATQMLLQLKEREIQLCMDDFGTGYSSLSYLHRFPLDTLKIDRSFVNPISSFQDKSEILQTIITLAHNLGMSVVAEGVETPVQKKTLRSLGCEFAQGYLFSKPVDAEGATLLIES